MNCNSDWNKNDSILLSNDQKIRNNIKLIKSFFAESSCLRFYIVNGNSDCNKKKFYFTLVFVCVICGKSLLLILEFINNERIQSVIFYSKNCLFFAIFINIR